ncbi:MAG: hypothetical protein HY050_01295 [Actinobacteria bacterium]|nr:hypothetical protein [Actinomycetota bacterium]
MNRRITGLVLVPLLLFGALAGATSAAAASTEIKVGTTKLGKIVVNGKGMSAYFYDLDKANSGKSACSGVCLSYWPPILSGSAKPNVLGISGRVSTITRSKGKRQITINGRPIYTYALDKAPGDVNGQGAQGIWHVLSAAGREIKATSLVTPSRTPTPSASSTDAYKRSY